MGIARVGTFDTSDIVRIFYPIPFGAGLGMASQTVKVWSNGILADVSPISVEAPGHDANGNPMSVQGIGVIETDRFEWPSNDQRNPSMAYWYQSSTTPTTAGQVDVVYKTFFDGVTGNGGSLPAATTTRLPDAVGDYMSGAFWYDNQLNQLRFLPAWPQFTAAGDGEAIHTEVVSVSP